MKKPWVSKLNKIRMKGNKYNLGRKASQETLEKRSVVMKKLWANGKMKGCTGKKWAKTIEIRCVQCGGIIRVNPNHYKKYGRKFCSRECKV